MWTAACQPCMQTEPLAAACCLSFRSCCSTNSDTAQTNVTYTFTSKTFNGTGGLQQGQAFILTTCTGANAASPTVYTDRTCAVLTPANGFPIPYTLAADSIKSQAMRTVVIGLIGAALLAMLSFV